MRVIHKWNICWEKLLQTVYRLDPMIVNPMKFCTMKNSSHEILRPWLFDHNFFTPIKNICLVCWIKRTFAWYKYLCSIKMNICHINRNRINTFKVFFEKLTKTNLDFPISLHLNNQSEEESLVFCKKLNNILVFEWRLSS